MAFLTQIRSIPLPIAQLSLAAVLKSGQSFRWSVFTPVNAITPVEYRLCLKDRVVCLRQSSDTLFYRSVFPDPARYDHAEGEAETLKWLRDYFQLDIDLVALYKHWAGRDSVFAKCQEKFEGIRVLRQDPWETLVSFICSSSSVARTAKTVQTLCNQYSPPLLSLQHPFRPTEVHTYHPFPPPSALCGSDVGLKLQSLGYGYRSGYLQRTAKMLVDTHGLGTPLPQNNFSEASEIWLKQLRNLSTLEARKELLQLVGVGRKIADSVLLMSLDKKEVVPVNTQVHQLAFELCGFKSPSRVKMTPVLYDEWSQKFLSVWGDYAGWAHSVLLAAALKSSSYGRLEPPSPALPTSSNSSTPEESTEMYLQSLGV